MLRIFNGRIVIGGASIGLPEGLYITDVLKSGNAIAFTDNEMSFVLELFSCERIEPLNIALKCSTETISEINDEQLDINALVLNGMEGYYSIYHSEKYDFYEARVQNMTNADDYYLRILITVPLHRSSIKKVMKKTTINDFFCDLRAL